MFSMEGQRNNIYFSHMRNIFLIAILSTTILISAGYYFSNKEKNQGNSSTNNPSWVNDFIKKEESNTVANPPASLTKCIYKNQTVYYVPPRCCDIPSVVFNDKGETICSPDGGETGRGDGKCSDFLESKTDCAIVWKDSR